MYELISYILSFLVLFQNIKILSKLLFNSFGLNNRDHISFISKIISIIHTIYVCTLAKLYLNNDISKEIFIEKLVITKAYLIFDLCIICIYNYGRPDFYPFLIHHLVFLFGLYTNHLYTYPQHFAIGLLAEITNPFLYFGWFLLKKRWMDNEIFIINALILLSLFFVYRVLNFTKLFIIALLISKNHIEHLLMLVITLLNIYWFLKLLEKFVVSILQ